MHVRRHVYALPQPVCDRGHARLSVCTSSTLRAETWQRLTQLAWCPHVRVNLQRELKRAVKRARTMNLIPYKSKLPQFQKSENPFADS
jgi:hypothetical protein